MFILACCPSLIGQWNIYRQWLYDLYFSCSIPVSLLFFTSFVDTCIVLHHITAKVTFIQWSTGNPTPIELNLFMELLTSIQFVVTLYHLVTRSFDVVPVCQFWLIWIRLRHFLTWKRVHKCQMITMITAFFTQYIAVQWMNCIQSQQVSFSRTVVCIGKN